MQYKYITTSDQLEEYCRALASCKSIAFDTEFVSEHTYRPVLCLVQVSAGDELAAIDAMEIDDLTPFWEVIAAAGHETIVHAGRGEMEFCLHATGRRPADLFDVQIAAALVGVEYPAGYGTLVSKLLGHKFAKHETRTDWRRRPLSKRQIEYALTDVLYLPELRNMLHQRLEELGRLSWMEEEMATWQEEVEKSLSHDRWHKVSGNTGLDSRALAVLRELYRWRDAEAKRRNQPARRVLRDDLIVELARRGTADPGAYSRIAGHGTGRFAPPHGRNCRLHSARDRSARGRIAGENFRQPDAATFGVGPISVCRLGQYLPPGAVGADDRGHAQRHPRTYCLRYSKNQTKNIAASGSGLAQEFVGRLFDNLLSGKVAIRITDPHADAPLTFEGAEGIVTESVEREKLFKPQRKTRPASSKRRRKRKPQN